MADFSKDAFKWFDHKWFTPDTLGNFAYEQEFFLWLIPFVPLVFVIRWLLKFGIRQKLEFAFPDKTVKGSPDSILRFIPPLILLTSFLLIMIALARPQKTSEKVEKWTEGIDIMLVLDISESMKLKDFKPNRLESAKSVAKEFITGRFQDRIGVVCFAGEALTLAPLTTDYELLTDYIDQIGFSMIQKNGTAIGDAISVGVNRFRESDTKSKIMILLSDGESNAGSINPIKAAQLANAYNIKIYTIGIGQKGKVPIGKDMFGNTRYRKTPPLDEESMKKIASIGNGSFYRVSNAKALENIFEKIDQLEKAEIKTNIYTNTRDFYDIYLTWGILFFIIWLFLKSTFMNNALED